MTFQAYLDTVRARTGMWPDDFLEIARAKGLIDPDVKIMRLVDWLAADYGLGRGHAMAIVQAFRNAGAIPPAPQRSRS